MAQSGFTPILLYGSSTASTAPLAANLTSSTSGVELALNYTDGKLYYKDNGGVVQLLASKAANSPVLTFSAGTTGLTPSTATSGAVTLAGTLIAANGGTGLTASGSNGNLLTSNGTTWTSSALSLVSPPAIGGTTPNTGAFTTLTDSYGNVRNVPQSGSAKTTSYTLATTDIGQYIQVGSGGSITIPNSTFATGNAVSLFNNTTGSITVTCSTTNAYIAGTDTNKTSVTLATRGVATILFISSTLCVISGNVS